MAGLPKNANQASIAGGGKGRHNLHSVCQTAMTAPPRVGCVVWNLSLYSLSSFKQITAETEQDDEEDSDADMDDTPSESFCVSNVSEITAGDIGISMSQLKKCELEVIVCYIKYKRKQITMCRKFNPDLRFLGSSILHHRKSIADPREAERLLGLNKKTLNKSISITHITYLSLSTQLYCIC